MNASPSNEKKNKSGSSSGQARKGKNNIRRQKAQQKPGKNENSKPRMSGPRKKTGKRSYATKPRGDGTGLIVFTICLGIVVTVGYTIMLYGPVTVGGVKIDLAGLRDKIYQPQTEKIPPQKQAADKTWDKTGDKTGDKTDVQEQQKTAQREKRPEFWYEKQLNPASLPSRFEGTYLSFFGTRQFELYIANGIYQLVLSRRGDPVKEFSRGTYGYRDGILALKPDLSVKRPAGAVEGSRYKQMTDKVEIVDISSQANFMTWEPVIQPEDGRQQIVKHPAFYRVDANRLVWQPLETVMKKYERTAD